MWKEQQQCKGIVRQRKLSIDPLTRVPLNPLNECKNIVNQTRCATLTDGGDW